MTARIYVPQDAAARSVGAKQVEQALLDAVGEQIEIVQIGTRGMLWLEPLIEVDSPHGRIGYGPVQASDVSDLIEAGLLDGDLDHPLCLGLTEEIPFLARQERLTFSRVGVIDRLSLSDYQAHGGLVGLKSALSMPPSEIVNQVTAAGLRGRGGAGFPTGIKWKTALAQPDGDKYICANADEGDSGTFADRMLMEGDPYSLIEGMIIAGRAIGADTGYIYIRSEYPHAIHVLRQAIAKMEHAGWLGDNICESGTSFTIHLRIGAGAYICGEESSMLESIEGKRGQVKVKPPIPAISGLFGRPTIVNNVLTLASVPYILANGAEAYAKFGKEKSLGTQPFQLAGDIKQGGLVELGFGATLRQLIEEFGAGSRSGLPIKAAQLGGPLGGYLPPDKFDVEMGYESLAEAGSMLGHGGIVVFNETADMAKLARYAMEFCEIESCGKCTPCRIGSVRGKETLDKIIDGDDVSQNIELLLDLCELMEDASLCAMGGLTPMPVRTAMQHFPDAFTGSSHQTTE